MSNEWTATEKGMSLGFCFFAVQNNIKPKKKKNRSSLKFDGRAAKRVPEASAFFFHFAFLSHFASIFDFFF